MSFIVSLINPSPSPFIASVPGTLLFASWTSSLYLPAALVSASLNFGGVSVREEGVSAHFIRQPFLISLHLPSVKPASSKFRLRGVKVLKPFPTN